VKGLGSSPLVVDDKQTGGKAGGDQTAGDTAGNTEENGVITNAYKHGLQVEFNGSFMSTLEYIKELEALDDKFIWDNLRLDIGEYPEGRAAVTVFTLSLDRNWIGT